MKKRKIKKTSHLEETFALQIRALRLPEPVREYRFNEARKFRFDFAWPNLKIAVEIDGGTWSGGRHVRGAGYHNDAVKQNMAACSGWAVLRGDGKMVTTGALIASLEQLIEMRMADGS